MKDINLQVTRALPTADGTVTSSDFNLGATAPGQSLADTELVVEIPALSAVNLPNADTLTITVQSGASAAPTASANLVKVITGTGSAIAAQEVRFRLPTTIGRYVNVKIVAAGGTGDMSGVTATISLQSALLK